MHWFEDVMFYGFKDNSFDPDDEDTNFIPRLAEKVLVPKLTGHYLLFCCMGSGNNQSYSVQSTHLTNKFCYSLCSTLFYLYVLEYLYGQKRTFDRLSLCFLADVLPDCRTTIDLMLLSVWMFRSSWTYLGSAVIEADCTCCESCKTFGARLSNFLCGKETYTGWNSY